MEKPRFKLVKASKNLVRLDLVNRSCASRAIIDEAHAICLLASRVADGQVYGTCRSHKCFVDFQAFVQQVIVPEAVRRKVKTVTLILDHGTTHAPKQLEGWLEQLEGSLPQPLHFQVSWLPTNASWLDQIEIWFSILQRKRLQPNHFRSPEDLEPSILDFLTSYNQTAKPIKWTYTVDKLECKLGTHL